MKTNYIKRGDCLELMKEIPSGSVDLILCDLPYGTMKGAALDGWNKQTTYWDDKIDTTSLFEEYTRVLRENGVAILFSQEPYTSELRNYTNASLKFAYPMIWLKDHFANALIAKRAPVSYFEDLSVFVKEYDRENKNPLRIYFRDLKTWIGVTKRELIETIGQRADHCFRSDSLQFKICTRETYEDLIRKYHINKCEFFKQYDELEQINRQYCRIFNLPNDDKFTGNVLDFKKEYKRFHPTQKPVALLEHLIKLYTNESDVVLDNCMGSGSTCIAAIKTKRKYIGFELDEKYFEVAQSRITDYELTETI